MKKLLVLTLLATLFFIACKETESKAEIKVVSTEEMQTLLELDDVQLLDVRTPDEYKSGFINNAQNIDYYSKTFDQDVAKLDKSKPVIVYCKSGGRSAKCAEKMKAAGFVKIYDLDGGISKWKHKGLEIKQKS